MNRDTFAQGIEPGGLRTSSDIKMLICYVLGTFNEPLSESHLFEALQEGGLANYFEIGQAISELSIAGNLKQISENGEKCYTITDEGRRYADSVETVLPISVREKAVKTAIYLKSKTKTENENRVEIQKRENGYFVTCTVLDGNKVLMSVGILVADELQALSVKEQFLDNPSMVYGGILALLSGKKEIFGEIMKNDKN